MQVIQEALVKKQGKNQTKVIQETKEKGADQQNHTGFRSHRNSDKYPVYMSLNLRKISVSFS